MPRLDLKLNQKLQAAIDLAHAGESVRKVTPWNIHKLESLYELAFLKAFIAWECFLEDTFYRCLCGYNPMGGGHSPLGAVALSGPPMHSLADAEKAVLSHAKMPYIAWYRCRTVIGRCRHFITNGHHEAVIASHQVRLDRFGKIRHRIAHGQPHAKSEFDATTFSLSGTIYRGSRAGKFLRDWDTGTFPKKTWLETITSEFSNLAVQIA